MQSYYMPNKRTISRIDYIVCIKRLDTSDDEREGNCNLKGWEVAKHYTTAEEVAALKMVLQRSDIDSSARQVNTILSKLLEGIASRGIAVTNQDLHID